MKLNHITPVCRKSALTFPGVLGTRWSIGTFSLHHLQKLTYMLLLSGFLLIACSDDDQSEEPASDSPDYPEAQGFEIRDELGYYKGNIGTPNVNTGDHPTNNPDSSEYHVNIYPNPVIDTFNLHFTGTDIALDTTEVELRFKPMVNKIYPMGGPYEIKDHDFSDFDDSTPLELSVTPDSNGHVRITIHKKPDDPSSELLPEGLYRVNVLFNDVELYDNLYLKED